MKVWRNNAMHGVAGLALAALAIGVAADTTSAPGDEPAFEIRSNDTAAGVGPYTIRESVALQVLLDAPLPVYPGVPSLDSFAIDPQFQVDLTSLQIAESTGPRALSQAVSAEAKSYMGWDFQSARVVPEPASALLMAVGLAALAIARVRRRDSRG